MKTLLLFFLALFLFEASYSQGCIAVRTINSLGQYNLNENAYSTTNWQLNLTNRYFRSFRDFKEGTDLNTPEQNQFVNKVYTFDISLTRLLSNGWSMNLSMPITSNSRTSANEHGGPNTTRRSTHSFGAGDLHITAYKWLLSPSDMQKWNVQLGLGLKFPTGDYRYQDYFYRDDATRVLSGVNPGIQLGDGGTGIITELNTFYLANKTLSFYGSFYYLTSPREQNGMQFTTGRTPSALQIKSGAVETSVPDIYSIRVGANINAGKWAFVGGIRDEGSPVNDLIGGSDGGRRAGYNLSIEPGILYRMKSTTLSFYLPFIIDRRIHQNVPDKIVSELTGVYTVSPGGSPNYQIFAGASFNF